MYDGARYVYLTGMAVLLGSLPHRIGDLDLRTLRAALRKHIAGRAASDCHDSGASPTQVHGMGAGLEPGADQRLQVLVHLGPALRLVQGVLCTETQVVQLIGVQRIHKEGHTPDVEDSLLARDSVVEDGAKFRSLGKKRGWREEKGGGRE